MTYLIDTHCHLDFEHYQDELPDLLLRATDAGVQQMILPAIDLANSPTVMGLADTHPSLFCAVGVHPNYTAEWQDSSLDQLRKWATSSPNVVSIGEIGLDYHWDYSPKEKQAEAFSAQMRLADELDLPIIIHNRKSSEDVVKLLQQSPLAGKDRAGVMHSFSADYAIAKQILDMGFYLGFTGPITFKNAPDLRELARKIPLDRILIETDAPYLTPHPYRGKRNEPARVVLVAEKLAEIHGKTAEEMAQITTENAIRLFQLPPIL